MKTVIVLITLALAATFAHGGSLQQHMRQGVVVQQSVAVKLENKASAQAFRGPAKQIRNLNYDALGHHENMILHQSVDVQNKRTPPQSPDPAIPLFMRLADASIDYKEWKSSMFCTQVDFSFPPAAQEVKIQLQLNIGIMGQTAYDANTQPTHPGLIKAEFMLGFGGTITGQFGKLEMSASLYVQGNMVLESRVPAEYLKGEDQEVYPLLGTVWAVKQWAMNKVKNSALYKWIQNRKKDISNQEITKLLVGIRSDLQGANDAAAKTACEAFCKNETKPCSPPNAENAVSADCVYGSVDWAAGAFVDFCGEMDVNTKRCKNGPYKNDNQIDSDAIMDSAAIKFSEFINELRANGNTLFENKNLAYTAHEISKANIYRETIEKAWRKVYLGVEEAPATKFLGMTFKHRMKCRNIKDVYDPTTKKIKDPLKAIMPLICAWMKYGGSLAKPKTGWFSTDGKDNENLKNGLIFMYKELFPIPATTVDPAFEKWIARLQTGKDPDMLKNGVPVPLKERSSFLGGWDSDTEYGININTFNCHAVHTILSLPPAEVMGSLDAMMDDLTDAGNEFKENKMAQKGCTPTKDGCCGLQKVSLTGTIGVTVGDSGVGFCTPDTNPLQVTRAKAIEWEVDETATKAGGVGAIKERKGYCFLGNGNWQPREITVTGVIPLDNAAPSKANHYMYINLFSKGNWALTWKPKQVGIQLSYMTKALEAPLTIALTPACVVLQAIKQTLQTAIRNLGNIFTGKPTIALALDVVSETKAQLPNAVKAYCDKPANACATTSETVGKEVLKYVALIGANVGEVGVNTIINTAGGYATDLSKALSGGQVEVGFGRDTYSQIDLKVTFDRKGDGALTLPESWGISTVDGDTGISFSMNNIASLSVEIGGVLSATGVDIKVAGYMGTGTSVDCSAQS